MSYNTVILCYAIAIVSISGPTKCRICIFKENSSIFENNAVQLYERPHYTVTPPIPVATRSKA